MSEKFKRSRLTAEEKHVRKERKITDYGDHTHHSHIYAKQGTYIGSVQNIKRNEFVFDSETGKILMEEIDMCEGIFRILLEILSNAGDNADDSRRMGVNIGDIKMWMDDNKITIRSGGKPLPVVPKQDKSNPDNCYTLVQHIFGVLLTSSHYDERVLRYSCGTNGYGAKLVNIFSKYFSVKVGDPENGQEHESVWENNMIDYVKSETTPGFIYDGNKTSKVVIKGKNEHEEDKIIETPGTWVTKPGPKYKGEAYVEVSWVLDFERFDCEKYPPEAYKILNRCLLDFGLSSKMKVSFNDIEYDVRSIKDYAKLVFTEEECNSAITHYEWHNGMPSSLVKASKKILEKKLKECLTEDSILSVEMLLLDTPDKAKCISFVNGLMTPEGGVHVDAAFDIILHEILKKFNSSRKNKEKDKKNLTEKEKLKEKEKEKLLPKLTIKDVRPHVSMILVCRLADTDYTSQSKTKLATPVPNFSMNEKFFKQMDKWELFDRLKATLKAKNFKMIDSKSHKGKGKFFGKKGENANFAGTSKSGECTLCITEGDSASAYAETYIVMTSNLNANDKRKGGQDYIGYLPLKGKPLNATNAPLEQLAGHEAFNNIKNYLGLKESVDYTDPHNLKDLKYGFLLGMYDSDRDSFHINSLIINWLYKHFPAILQNGMYGYHLTPQVKIKKGGENGEIIHRFILEEDYKKWEKENPNHKYFVKYYKGLGTSEDDDIRNDLDTAPTVVLILDENSGESLNVAFSKERIRSRKEWIQKMRDLTGVSDIQIISPNNLLKKQRTITNLIDIDLIDYNVGSFFRAIPNFKSGLKKSQMQSLYYFLEHWNYGNSKKSADKVAEIATAAGKMTHYHHGDDSLAKTIVFMAQNYVGSNNLNLFSQKGKFGTRKGNEKGVGKNSASSRYIYSALEWWIKYAFSKEMVSLIPKQIVEGHEAEPEWIPCKIPLHVINGAHGVATGWSTDIPCHNPIDVINWIISKCNGYEPGKLFPWYNHFNGNIKKVIIKPHDEKKSRLNIKITDEELAEESEDDYEEKLEEDDSEDEEEKEIEEDKSKRRVSIKTEGIFEITKFDKKKNTVDVLITEIPVGVGIFCYRKMLESLIPLKKLSDLKENTVDPKYNSPIINLKGLVVNCPVESSDKARKTCVGKQLKMTKALKINMHLIDMNGFPIKYNSIEEIMETYYHSMIEVYNLMISTRIRNAENTLINLNFHLKYITLLNNETIIIIGKNITKENIKKQIIENEIPVEFFTKVKVGEYTKEDINEYKEKIKKQKEIIEKLKLDVAEKLWINDLEEFKSELKKSYKKENKKSKLIVE